MYIETINLFKDCKRRNQEIVILRQQWTRDHAPIWTQ